MNNRKRMAIRTFGKCLNPRYRWGKWAIQMWIKMPIKQIKKTYYAWLRDIEE